MTTETKERETSAPAVFNESVFMANSVLYAEHKRIVDACSRYDNIDEAIGALQSVVVALMAQSENGSGYTPDSALGFGSENAAVIADTILGNRATTGAIRKAFALLGK